MPDPTPAPAPAPTPTPDPAPAKAKRTRSALNKEYLKEITLARAVAAAALDPAHTTALAGVDFDDDLSGRANTLSDQLEAALGTLAGTRAGKKQTTDEEAAARETLLAAIAPIQTAAKRKYKGTSIEQRGAYFIGGPKQLVNSTLEEVLTAARAIHTRLSPGANNAPPVDTLPGIKPLGAIKTLSDAIAAYDAKNTTQASQQEAAEAALEAIETTATELAEVRREIQLAADQAWPWRTPGVKTIRKAFELPEDRPFGD
jgi:hypothetical protein